MVHYNNGIKRNVHMYGLSSNANNQREKEIDALAEAEDFSFRFSIIDNFLFYFSNFIRAPKL